MQEVNKQLLHYTKNRFTALFRDHLGEPLPEEKLLDFMVQGKINRGRCTDHPAGRHSIRTNQSPPPPYPIFLEAGCPSCRPTNSVKALKATRSQQTIRDKYFNIGSKLSYNIGIISPNNTPNEINGQCRRKEIIYKDITNT